MKNPLMALSDRMKGILLIIGGSALVLNYFGYIKLLDAIVALFGVAMIGIGVVMAGLHTKIYHMIKKDNHKDQDHNQQPPQGF